MPRLLIVAGTLLAASAAADPKPPAARRDAWNNRPLVARGALAAVYVEPTLYRRADLPNGFVAVVWIRNLTDHPIAIDGPGERWFVHPNQWSVGDAPRRQTVDERTMVPLKLDATRRAELRERMQAGHITMLPAGSSLSSDVMFDGPAGSGPAAIDAQAGRYLIVSLDGQVIVADRDHAESLEAKAGGLTAADLTLPTPVRWGDRPLPAKK